MEKRLSKEEILFGYLTSSYYGFGAYGIGAAAEIYFDKSVADLDISESAVLAGVVQAPSRLSPHVDRTPRKSAVGLCCRPCGNRTS